MVSRLSVSRPLNGLDAPRCPTRHVSGQSRVRWASRRAPVCRVNSPTTTMPSMPSGFDIETSSTQFDKEPAMDLLLYILFAVIIIGAIFWIVRGIRK